MRNIRLLDPSRVTATYQSQQNAYGFYRINELDVDRYPISEPASGETGQQTTQVILGTRVKKDGTRVDDPAIRISHSPSVEGMPVVPVSR